MLHLCCVIKLVLHYHLIHIIRDMQTETKWTQLLLLISSVAASWKRIPPCLGPPGGVEKRDDDDGMLKWWTLACWSLLSCGRLSYYTFSGNDPHHHPALTRTFRSQEFKTKCPNFDYLCSLAFSCHLAFLVNWFMYVTDNKPKINVILFCFFQHAILNHCMCTKGNIFMVETEEYFK